ncbi:MAG: LLM class flavin-dependent oxidoreductase, partial [Polaromonas sp.]|nr:LLM class flavin-dependent oxidoreductase [Polaromonas sp.]
MAQTCAVFVGNGSLLMPCADAYLQAGQVIKAVATVNPDIVAWADAKGIKTVSMKEPARLALPGVDFDYLFSVANLDMLPASLIARAGKLAINFHDSLLPQYAGLNATSWALMAGEKTHGITWHEMTPLVDAGRIVRQASFAVSPDETAWSLNTQCYEAALSSFGAIVEDICRGEVTLSPQVGVRSYFSRYDRPACLATLDFSRPAQELANLVCALDFGNYANPLGRPKVLVGNALLTVGTALVERKSSNQPPGTVLAADGNGLRVATSTDDLLIGDLTDWSGLSARPALAVGQVLPQVPPQLRASLDARTQSVAKGESFWTRQLASLAPVEIGYPKKIAAAGYGSSRVLRAGLNRRSEGSKTVAGFLAWLSALSGREQVSVQYCDDKLREQADGLEAWLSPWATLTLAAAPRTTVVEAVACVELQIAKVGSAGPFARDLPSRLGDKAAAAQRLGRIGVCLDPSAPAQPLDLMLAVDQSGEQLELLADESVYARETVELMASHLAAFLAGFDSASRLSVVALLPNPEAELIAALNATALPFESDSTLHQAIAAQAERTPDQTAVCFDGRELSFRMLDQAATDVARQLVVRGVKPGDIVGLFMERTPDLIVGLLAILKAGGAYLPLDPDYPAERIAFMIEDSGTPLVLTRSTCGGLLALPASRTFVIDQTQGVEATQPAAPLPAIAATRAAYVIYTSGSTGKPKAVVVTHRNVMNFFAGMSARVPHAAGDRWLAVTSLSFDISVLELGWTLSRGLTVVLHSRHAAAATPSGPDFSLFYFASADAAAPKERYRLLLEGAKFADSHGFAAIWTPERHFHAFGGLYPNPAVTSAAIAAITSRLKIRAGSCVLPLHHPIRVAEEWAFFDNISGGRVGVSFAAGWQPNDFAIAPQAFANRKTDMMSNIEVVRKLWRGESVSFPGPVGKPVEVQTLPRPIQPELPIWLTAAGNPETFAQAGQMGCNLLTHLLGQSVEELAEKVRVYHAAWTAAGHAGRGDVTVMLHSFVGQDEDSVRETVREPMKAYLRSSVDLIKQAAWSFPTFVQRGEAHGKTPLEIMNAEELSADDMDALLEHAFNRYYGTSALFGTPARCLALVEKLKAIGVSEIACLIDFGIAPDVVLDHLSDLAQLMDASRAAPALAGPASVAGQIGEQRVTHLQCTPSMASMLVADAEGRAALANLSALLVGGEALPLELARQLRALVRGTVLNMYGPTETTVWSTCCDLADMGEFVPLGAPIANTRLSVRTPGGIECPALLPGELLIGGAGVTDGYLGRPELTAERFIDAPDGSGKFYRTGDLVRRHPDGALEFLGRIDHQVKIRGHRIELGEIENALASQPGVRQAVVVARGDASGEQSLVAYVTARAGQTLDVEALRQALGKTLPDVMVPRSVMSLASFPMTPNGKVDRKALPTQANAPVAAPPTAESAPASAQHDAMEATIAGLWQDVLGLATVGRTDNFFDLGGHSLLVVQVQRRLREATGREVSITDMFRLPTVRALAAH